MLRNQYYEKAPHNTVCNICQQEADKLTKDHVPPKSCLLDLNLQLEPFGHGLRVDGPKPRWSQSGLRYRTICGPCNSLLGHRYDPALARMWKAVNGRLRSVIAVAPRWGIWCEANWVIRAVFGHLLAAVTEDPQTKPDLAMRPAVLDPTAPLPGDLHVFYWLHRHPEIVVLRGVAMPAVRGRADEFGIFDIFKFAPLGFLVTDLKDYEGLPRLDHLARRAGTREIEVPFHTGLVRDADWPERVDRGNIMVHGRSMDDAVVARPRRPKAKLR